MNWAWYWIAFLATSLLFACAFEPEGAIPYVPPPEYRVTWDSAQACTGRHRDYSRLRFWVVPGDGFYRGDEALAGYTRFPNIYIAEGYLDHPMVVKHEMIHALGVNGHPRVPFADPCHATWESYGG